MWNSYIPVVTLSTEDKAKSSKLLTEKFKRPVYCSKYKINSNRTYDRNDNIYEKWEMLNSSYQGIEKLFVLVYRDQGGANSWYS